MNRVNKLAGVFVCTLGAAALLATAAAADGLAVTGEAYYGTDAVQFTVENTSDAAAFFDVQYDGGYKARHMQIKAGESLPVGFELAEGESAALYTVTVYSGRTPGDDARSLSGETVYAALPDGNVPMATYPGFDAAGFTPNGTFYYDGTDYDLAEGAAATPCAGGYAYAYAPYTPAALTGSVHFVDATGALLHYTESLAGITAENPVSKALASFEENGVTYYPTVGSVTATYDGQINFTILCNKTAVPASAGNYRATIRMVDENGKTLMTDSVNVNRVYTYSLPQTFVLTSANTAARYTLQEGQGSVFTMQPGDAGDATAKVYTYTYVGDAADTEACWMIRRVNGVTGLPLDPEYETVKVLPGETKTYTPADITLDGTVYKPVGDAQYSYTYGGSNLLQTVYYVPDGYTPENSYDITVQYLNIATGAVLNTESVTVQPGQDTVLTVPATYGDGAYVRLGGQADSYRHSYYSPKRTYTIYYRGVDDILYADTVINVTQTVITTRTEYNVVTLPPVDGGTTDTGTVDGGTTVLPGTTTVLPGTTTTGAASATGGTGGTYRTGPAAGQELTTANNDTTGQSNLLTENGRDTATVRDEVIAENEAPLAGPEAPAENAAEAEAAAGQPLWQKIAYVGLGLLCVALIALLALAFVNRRRNRDED